MTMSKYCLKSFAWEGTPTGHVSQLGNNDTYKTGASTDQAVLHVHDALGWTFPNIRLLADRYVAEIDATIYVPDLFGGEVLPFEPVLKGRFHEIDFAGFPSRNSLEIREPEIFEAARLLRQKH